jgi:hypothetical protein
VGGVERDALKRQWGYEEFSLAALSGLTGSQKTQRQLGRRKKSCKLNVLFLKGSAAGAKSR